jgi:hypothetical protein
MLWQVVVMQEPYPAVCLVPMATACTDVSSPGWHVAHTAVVVAPGTEWQDRHWLPYLWIRTTLVL